jgi:hypothetical protein
MVQQVLTVGMNFPSFLKKRISERFPKAIPYGIPNPISGSAQIER